MKTSEKVNELLTRALTVADLIDELSGLDPKTRVVFGCDYGDHHHTEQALPLREISRLEDLDADVVESAYSHSGLALRERREDDGDEERDDEEKIPVVVLR